VTDSRPTLLTGATGFVGSAVARTLVARGHHLRLLVRRGSDRRNLLGIAAETAEGDLTDAASLRRAAEGCRYVLHVAADYRLWVPDERAMMAANVEGTRALMRAAMAAGAERVVYCSSVAALGLNADGSPADETTPAREADMIGAYKRSKFLAEQVAIAAARAGQHVVIVNPTTPIGERDIKPTPTGRIIVDFLKRKFPAYVDTGLNLVDARDCAEGHIAALEKARPGERYILGGENLTLKQILDKLAALTGLPSPSIRLPYAVAYATGVVDTLFTGALRKREPRVTLDSVRMGRKKMFVTSARAERELGWNPQPIEDALRRAVDWFHANGYA
jgi:dihydroflavonol-4-reductase